MKGIRSLRDARHVNKMFYLGADELFYEPVEVHYEPSTELKSVVEALIGAGDKQWKIWRRGVWSHVGSAAGSSTFLPIQGWKIHISATDNNCKEILKKVASIALEHEVQFKYANDINTLKMMTSKRWPRGGSGKFITIYPRNTEQFRFVIDKIHQSVEDDVGSYILSDKRYKNCRCLYYRYGGILQEQRLDYMGKHVPILISPTGEEIADTRTPYFTLPSWEADPFPNEAEDSAEMTLNNGRFLITKALGFSNTGGVYLATDTTSGTDVVIKEARPYIELHGNGHDAVARLKNEERFLRIIGNSGFAPQVITSFYDWENFYLAEEYCKATDIRVIMLANSPLFKVNPSQADSLDFYILYKKIFSDLFKALDYSHRNGIIIGDLSPPNILIDKDTYSVKIIDLEAAHHMGIDDPSDIYTPGFRNVGKRRKAQSSYSGDRYAVASLMVYSMFPVVAISYLRDDLFEKILPIILKDIGWSGTPLEELIRGLADDTITWTDALNRLERQALIETPFSSTPVKGDLSAEDCCRELAQFLIHNYRLDDKVTLFPIDPFALHTNPLSFGFGSTGVIYSLIKCGFEVPTAAIERYKSEISEITSDQLSPGFLTGAAGISMALLDTGDKHLALNLLNYANNSPLLNSHHCLYYGLAGVGLANLFAYRHIGGDTYLQKAIDIAESLSRSAIDDDKGIHWEDNGVTHLGFGYGQSGVALFFLRLSQILNTDTWALLGRKALQYDLSHGYEIEPGVVSYARAPDETVTYEQYIEEGSAGIIKVAIRYGQWNDVDRILADIHRKYCLFPGLIYGLSGFIDVLVDAFLYSGDAKYLKMAQRPMSGLLDFYMLKQSNGHAVPGENLFRISSDYATGIAGVLRTMHRLHNLTPGDLTLDELDKFSGIKGG